MRRFIGAPIYAKLPPMRALWIRGQALMDPRVTPRFAIPLEFKPIFTLRR